MGLCPEQDWECTSLWIWECGVHHPGICELGVQRQFWNHLKFCRKRLFQAGKEYSPQGKNITVLQGIFSSGNDYSSPTRNILLGEWIFQPDKEYSPWGTDFQAQKELAFPHPLSGSREILPDIHRHWEHLEGIKSPQNPCKQWENLGKKNILPSNPGYFMGCKPVRNSMFLGNTLPSG